MVNVRGAAYNAVWLLAFLLPAAGCGDAAGPPPGAPQSATPPTVELDIHSGPMDPAAGTTDSTSPAGSPSDEKGDERSS